MSGEDGKLKENSRQATIESIIQLYERGELHQHYQHLASPSIAGEEFQRCFDRENPSSIYFLTQLIEEVTGESTAAPAVYRLLSKKQKKKVIDARHYSKESFFSLFRFIRSATKEQLQRYGHPAGLYFLARDMEDEGFDTLRTQPKGGAHPGQLYRCVGQKKWLQYLVGERASDLSWQPRSLDLSVSRIDAICNFLKDSYHKDREQFFNVYGSKAGCVFLAQQLKENLIRLSMLLSSTEVLTAIMEINNPLTPQPPTPFGKGDGKGEYSEFEKRFNPYPVRLPLKVVEAVLEKLQSAYLADTEAFFERYGSRLGVVHLARDLIADGVCKYINIEGLSSMLRDGEMVFQLLSHFLDAEGIEKKTMSSRFKPWYITLPLATIESLIQFLKERYNEDADVFFARYGAENGVFALAKDLEVEKKLSVHLTQLSNLLADGKELAFLVYDGCLPDGLLAPCSVGPHDDLRHAVVGTELRPQQ